MVPLVTREPWTFLGSQWYPIGANVTIGRNVGTNGTIGSPNGRIGKPNGVNNNIMINPSNIFLYFSFSMCIFQNFCSYHRNKNGAYLLNL